MDTPLPQAQDGREKQARTMYLALWFPLLSETFVYYEVEGLHGRGLPVAVTTLYGDRTKNIAGHMRESGIPVTRLGIPAIPKITCAVLKSLVKRPGLTWSILSRILFTRWRDIEMRLENYWACICGFYLAEPLREAGIGHVHCAWASGPATAAWVVNRLTGIPYSFTARATDVRPPDGFLGEKLADCAFARADSSFNVPHLRSFLPEDQADRVCLVYNPMTLPAVDPAPVLMSPKCRVIAIGRLIEKKGFNYLIRAARLLKERKLPVEITIVGGGGLLRSLKQECAANGVEDLVTFTGALPHDQIAGMLLKSDILAMPSIVPEGTEKSDGLPTVIVEAMSMGVPVVATDVASISDVVRDGETGRLLPQKDEKALADAIEALATNREEALRMAASARTMVRDMLSPDNTYGRMWSLFQEHADRR